MGKGKSIDIRNIGTVSIPANSKFLKSKHDLHSPEITKKLIDVTKGKFYPTFFYEGSMVKENTTPRSA